ncbi:MAG: chemotaxis protein CheA [Chloroflexi bacterium]|nr:chemotaxis protein CheA [Chloroflexota bacterium]
MELASDITPEDLQVFLQEAEEHLQLLDEDFIRLEREQDNQDLLQEIFRAAHTLKGSSAMLGHERMTALAHVMETLLDNVRKGTQEVTTEVIDALLHSLDGLNLLKDELIDDDAPETDVTSVIEELERATRDGEGAAGAGNPGNIELKVALDEQATAKLRLFEETGGKTRLVRIAFFKETEWAAVRCFQALDALESLGEVLGSNPTQEDVVAERVDHELLAVIAVSASDSEIENAVRSVEDVETVSVNAYDLDEEQAAADEPSAQSAVAGADAASSRQQGQKSQTVRIDVERLDDLMNMIGELIIDRTRIVQISKALEAQYAGEELIQALSKTSDHIVRVVDELKETTMQIRMLPIGTVFSSFPRLMRDLAQRVNKQVNFTMDGQDTEIDRTVIDRIKDPLIHLLRNALDHGVETPEERVAKGKTEEGNVHLSAFQEQGNIVITVQDDGNGIDPEKIRQAMVKKGLISAEAASRLTDAEAIDLIFLPGASTAAKTTDISGRGVGMDIVKSNIEAINGFVNIETVLGEGTKFILRLPLTLATLHAMLVTLDNTLYAIPLVYVLEAVNRERADISTIEGREAIRLRGSVLPLVHLGQALGIPGSHSKVGDQTWVVIVKFGEKLVGLAVDELTELQEIVVKSLGQYIGNVKGIAGASVLGDGRVVLILDIATLMNLITQNSDRSGVFAA